jgi:hypothetical protein
MDIKRNFGESNYFNKYQVRYNIFNRIDEELSYRFRNQISYRSFKNTKKYGKNLTNFNLFTNTSFLKLGNINLSNFLFYNNFNLIDNLEENYENLKNIKSLNFLNYKNINFSLTSNLLPMSYATVLDSFRANFEENN